MSTLAVQGLTKENRAFIFSSFGGSFAKYSGLPARRDFDRYVMEPFGRALEGGAPTVLVLADSPDDFVAWALIQGQRLVYAYVKEAFRDRGVGRSLLPDGLKEAVHQTPAGMRLQRWRYGRVLRHVPYALLHGGEVAA